MLSSGYIEIFQRKIDELADGQEFTIPVLMGETWASENYGSQIGKDFKQAVQSNEIKSVVIVNVKVTPAIYRKRSRQ